MKVAKGLVIDGKEYMLDKANSATYDAEGNNISEYYQPALTAGDGIDITDGKIGVKLHYVTVEEP